MPVFLDELQLAKDSHGNVNFNVYELASGSGKLRGNKQLGLNYTPTWATTFITSGETPIVKETDGEGALNRVFEIECYSGQKVIEDGHTTSNILKANYGHAGKMFVSRLCEDENVQKARDLYEQFYSQCVASDTTEKQAMAASAILVADALATEWIFQDDHALTLDDISEYLKTKERVSLLDRGYDLICDWVAVNASKMRGHDSDSKSDCYGLIDSDDQVAYFIRSEFKRVCEEYELNEKGMLSHLRSRGLLLTDAGKFTKMKYLGNGMSQRCVAVVLPEESFKNNDEQTVKARNVVVGDSDPLPF